MPSLLTDHRLGCRAVSFSPHSHQVATSAACWSGKRDSATWRLPARALPLARQRWYQTLRSIGLQLDTQWGALSVWRSDGNVGGPLPRWQHTEDQQHSEVRGVRMPCLEQCAASLSECLYQCDRAQCGACLPGGVQLRCALANKCTRCTHYNWLPAWIWGAFTAHLRATWCGQLQLAAARLLQLCARRAAAHLQQIPGTECRFPADQLVQHSEGLLRVHTAAPAKLSAGRGELSDWYVARGRWRGRRNCTRLSSELIRV